MIKEREPALERLNVIFQVILTLGCFYVILWISGQLASDHMPENKESLILAFVMAPIWFGLLELFDMGAMLRVQRYRHIIKKYLLLVAIATVSLIMLIELFHYQTLDATLIVQFGLLNLFVLTGQKLTGRMIMKYFRRKGYNSRLILIIADDFTIPFIQRIIETDDWGYKIQGVISNSKKLRKKYEGVFPVHSEEEDFEKIIDEDTIDEVFFCKRHFKTKGIEKLIAKCRDIGVSFNIHNNVLSFSGLKPRLSFLNHQFFLSFRNTPGNYFALIIKNTIDFFMTILILIGISPLLITLSLLIKLDDGGPVFFKQTRVGKHGRLFKLLKFRTMVINAESLKESLMDKNEQDGPVFKIKNDPRITKIGRFLRKTSLDELPQFINVLMGDMSIVGPRPPVPSEVKQYKRCLNRRLSITPGITCIWQVSGRNNIPFDKWMEMDMEYIDNWSLMLDFIIILKTFKVFFAGNGQ